VLAYSCGNHHATNQWLILRLEEHKMSFGVGRRIWWPGSSAL